MSESVTDSKKPDYLEVDEAIPGQNYVCLSFISPESLIQNKDAFKCVKFLQSYCKEQNLKFDDVYSKYQDFIYKYEDKLQRDFDEQNDFYFITDDFDNYEIFFEYSKKFNIKPIRLPTFNFFYRRKNL
mgnify:CR=1 FL=1